MTEREALKLALEALNEWRVEWSPDFYEGKYDSDEPEENTRRTLVKSAITAAEKALAQPEQEPVAWMRDDEMKAMVSDEKRAWILCGRSELIEEYNKPLYTTPPYVATPRQRKPLTEERIIEATEHIDTSCHGYFVHITRAIEFAHGIKE